MIALAHDTIVGLSGLALLGVGGGLMWAGERIRDWWAQR